MVIETKKYCFFSRHLLIFNKSFSKNISNAREHIISDDNEE